MCLIASKSNNFVLCLLEEWRRFESNIKKIIKKYQITQDIKIIIMKQWLQDANVKIFFDNFIKKIILNEFDNNFFENQLKNSKFKPKTLIKILDKMYPDIFSTTKTLLSSNQDPKLIEIYKGDIYTAIKWRNIICHDEKEFNALKKDVIEESYKKLALINKKISIKFK